MIFPMGKDTLFSQLRDWETRLWEHYESAVSISDEHYESVTKKAINLGSALDKLPAETRRLLLRDYQKIIGFPKIAKDIQSSLLAGKPMPYGAYVVKGVGKDGGVVRLGLSSDDIVSHPLGTILNRLSLQVAPDTFETTIGRNILSADFLEELHTSLGTPLEVGKKALIFDTETAGLAVDSGLRQLSWLDTTIGSDIPLTPEDAHFMTHRMQFGYVADAGIATGHMSDFFKDQLARAGKGYVGDTPFAGEDFARGMVPFLEKLRSTDYVVGHNIQFDLDQVFQNLRNTAAYQENLSGFKDLLDEAAINVFSGGKLKDTLEMARTALPKIDVAAELAFAGEARTHSIENLLLQTNMGQLLRDDLGDSQFKALFGLGKTGSLHAADVDTSLTAYLLKYIQSGTLAAGQLGGDKLFDAARASVLKSYAPTPISKIADVSHVDKRIFSRLLGETGGITTLQGDSIDVILARHTGTHEELYERFMSGDLSRTPLRFNLTPLEQEIFLTRRNLVGKAPSSDETLLASLGKFRRFAGTDTPYEGLLNRNASLFKMGIRPDQVEFEALQEAYQRSGLPFAGLSLPERWMTHGMASAAGVTGQSTILDKLSSAERILAGYDDDLGISRFEEYESIRLTKNKRNINISPELIIAAEKEGIINPRFTATADDALAFFDYSAFASGPESKMVNLMMKMEEAEAARFSSWINERLYDPKFTIDVDGEKRTIRSFFDDTSDALTLFGDEGDTGIFASIASERGVGVARMRGSAGKAGYEVIQNIHQGLVTDRAQIGFRAGLVSRDSGVIRVGAWVSGRLDDDFITTYRDDLKVAKERLGSLVALGQKSSSNLHKLKAYSEAGIGGAIERSLRGYEAIAKHAPKALIGAAIVGGVALWADKRQENEYYDNTLEEMDYESYVPARGYIDQIPINTGTRYNDPLATAGVVNTAHKNRIGHTQMGNDRYSHLFSV